MKVFAHCRSEHCGPLKPTDRLRGDHNYKYFNNHVKHSLTLEQSMLMLL